MKVEETSVTAMLATRAARTLTALALAPEAGDVLARLVQLDTDPSVAEALQDDDAHHRSGILSWLQLYRSWEGDVVRLEIAVHQLRDWGLVQVVGEQPGDPIVPGDVALRLTYWGRRCLGLAPGERAAAPMGDDETRPWWILHGASRERLLMAVWRKGDFPLISVADPVQEAALCGQIAAAIGEQGGAVLDATAAPGGREGARLWQALERVLRRTTKARGGRYLLALEPSWLRAAALACGAELRWVEPKPQTRRGDQVLDEDLTDALLRDGGGHVDVSDACGVPDLEVGAPRAAAVDLSALMVPDAVSWQLKLVLAHARYRLGLVAPPEGVAPPVSGYKLLLSGLPGTGKSMAAEALAHALGRQFVRLDLSAILSRWLGETERTLAQVFDLAESSGAVLVLDEAESLLRQRSGGQDGIATAVAYLLTRMERFRGLLVATTNRTGDLDEAFFRRFDDFVVMPLPDEVTRARLWRFYLGLDDADARVDVTYIAAHFSLSGGLVQGAAVRALAWVSSIGEPLSTALVLASLVREMEKSDRAPQHALASPYAADVRRLLGGEGGGRGR